MDLRPGTADDHAAIRDLLQDSRLPVDDFDTAAIDFIVAVDAADLVGVVGIEPFGDVGLLRSLAVRGDRRGQRIGESLADAVEARATALGLRQLVLLTETASSFFAKRGYAAIARAMAPSEVQRSAEFRSICPASATCMAKSIGTGE